MAMTKGTVRLGCAPINWTNDDLPELGGELTFEQCVSEMALAGFEGSEVGTKYPTDKATLKKALDLRGLVICNQWFSTLFTTEPEEVTLEAFKKHLDFTFDLGARVVGCAECGVTIHGDESLPIFEGPKLTDEQFDKIAAGLNKMGAMAKEKGMKVAYHYHMGTGIETLEDLDKLMERTDPELVGITFDTGHATFAGEDAVAVLEKYKNRVNHVHVKDVRSEVLKKAKDNNWSFLTAVKNGIYTVPGDGDMVDWDGVFDILNDIDYRGWIVVEAEQDPAIADPLEYAMKARKFIKEKTGI